MTIINGAFPVGGSSATLPASSFALHSGIGLGLVAGISVALYAIERVLLNGVNQCMASRSMLGKLGAAILAVCAAVVGIASLKFGAFVTASVLALFVGLVLQSPLLLVLLPIVGTGIFVTVMLIHQFFIFKEALTKY